MGRRKKPNQNCYWRDPRYTANRQLQDPYPYYQDYATEQVIEEGAGTASEQVKDSTPKKKKKNKKRRKRQAVSSRSSSSSSDGSSSSSSSGSCSSDGPDDPVEKTAKSKGSVKEKKPTHAKLKRANVGLKALLEKANALRPKVTPTVESSAAPVKRRRGRPRKYKQRELIDSYDV